MDDDLDDERRRKIVKGRERLAEFRRRKDNNMSGNSSPSHSDASFSISPDLLPENKIENVSGASSISEHISSINSIENDRSFQEIEISSKLIDRNISQELHPSLNSSLDEATDLSASKNAKSILEEILRDDQFRSNSEKLISDSEDASLDIFEGVNLDDNSINNYVSRLKSNEDSLDGNKNDAGSVKNIIDDGHRGVESLKESNMSTYSLNTTLTDYKLYQDECSNKIAEFENALVHRDRLIADLTESVQKSLANEQEYRVNYEQCAAEIQTLQAQLAEATNFVKTHRCESAPYDSLDEKHVSEKSEKSTENKTFDEICGEYRETLDTAQQITAFAALMKRVNEYIAQSVEEVKGGEIKILQDKMENEKLEHDAEIVRLKEFLENAKVNEIADVKEKLELTYLKEMEELRTYYEKKCADMEKHYSDEVISQHNSRKMSGSSTSSEAEYVSDLIYGPAPVPNGGGDTPSLKQSTFTKTDLHTLTDKLKDFTQKLNKYDAENLSDEDFDLLKSELFALDLKKLLKLDLVLLKNDLQSKYNAELEILRDEHENRINSINVEHENKLKDVENCYLVQIDALKGESEELQRNLQHNLDCAVQEAANSGEYELADIVKSYQIKMEEQVTIAKIDILHMLENRIKLLASNACDDAEWPEEFLQIRNCFTEKYERELADQKLNHEEEIAKLKEEHLKTMNGALERARRRSLRDSESFADLEVIKERNNLKKSSTVLRNLVTELLKYFRQCEDELNVTLVEELVKLGFTDSEGETNPNDTSNSSSSKGNESMSVSKRVHLTPDLSDFMSKVENTSFDSNLSLDYKSELETCLERLKSEANAVFALSVNLKEKQGNVDSGDERAKSLEERITSLTRQLITDSQIKEDLSAQLEEARNFVRSLEADRQQIENHSEQLVAKNRVLENELGKARDKISELVECGRKEIVSEGYGETDKIGLQRGTVSRASLSELQERARLLATESSIDADHPLLRLVEDLCTEGERLLEDAKREREDFTKQIEVADKKLRATTTFLEEQAIEREQERDEASKDITALREQLRERDKEKSSYERIIKESGGVKMNQFVHEDIVRTVEHLELQMRDMSKIINDGELRYEVIEKDHTEAVEKIHLLRGIITDLETQLILKKETESELQDLIVKLKEVVSQQREANDELSARLEAGGDFANYHEHIQQLENEVQKLRLTNELAGNEGVLKQIKLQLHEIELSIDRSISELENSHSLISSTSCSSPSEEMSIRDQVRPPTPSSTLDECEIPLQQLARLKEKLIKHSRAEHAAVKKIRDLEMQLVSSKHELDEASNEREVLQEQISEQLVLISSLQIRLDDQRIRAEHNQKQTNASLEAKIYDLENDLQCLRDTLHAKENSIKILNKTIEQTKNLLVAREQELSTSTDETVLKDLQLEIIRLKSENEMLRVKIESDAQNAQLLPSLVDNIISDKNKDIDILRNKLSETERQLDSYLTNFSSPEILRKATVQNLDLSKEHFEPEISCIERIGSPNIHYTVDAPLIKPNSTEIHKSVEKKVHFQERDDLAKKTIQLELVEAKMTLSERENDVEMLQEDAKRKDDMYFKLAKEKRELDKELERRNEEIENIQRDLNERENNLQRDLNNKKDEIRERDQINSKLEKEVGNKNKQLKSLNDELLQIKNSFDEKFKFAENERNELLNKIDALKNGADKEISQIKNKLIDRECELEILNEDVTRYQNEISALEDKLKYDNTDQLKLMKQRKEVAEKDLEIVKLKTSLGDLNKEIIHLQDYLNEKDKIIEQIKTDSECLRLSLETIRAKMCESGNVIDLREKLTKEIQKNALLQAELGDRHADISIDEISEQVQKQLDYSAQLDESILNTISTADYANIDDIEILRTAINKERQRNLQLKQKLNELENKIIELNNNAVLTTRIINELKHTVETERKKCNEIEIEDANLLEQMRIKLEAALENENDFEAMLNQEKLKRSTLENEIANLRLKKENLSSASSKTEYKSLPNEDYMRLQNELQILTEDNQRLKKDLKSLKKLKSESDAGLKYTKDVLNLKLKDVEKLELDRKELNEELFHAKEENAEMQMELQQKMREVENSRLLIDELEQEKMEIKFEFNQMNERIKLLQDEHDLKKNNPADLSLPVPEQFLQRMKELSSLVGEHMKENKLMTTTITKLTDEKNHLLGRIETLQEQYDFKLPFDDPNARANHLFGKYLRANSYRNALAWQKKYLVRVLATYQDFPRDRHNAKHRKSSELKGINKFRSAICVVIAIIRMKYMVQRWHSGTRGGAYTSLHRKSRQLGANFQVGQPVSSQHFSPTNRKEMSNFEAPRNVTPPPPETLPPWSGYTPPSKERNKPSTSSTSNLLPLQAPDLTKYIERFNMIQQTLGMALDSHQT